MTAIVFMDAATEFVEHNIELSSAAEYAQRSRFLAERNSQLQAAFKATAPTICYVDPAAWATNRALHNPPHLPATERRRPDLLAHLTQPTPERPIKFQFRENVIDRPTALVTAFRRQRCTSLTLSPPSRRSFVDMDDHLMS